MSPTYNITESNLYKILQDSRTLKFRKNQVIQSTDYKEAIMLLSEGYVKRYKLNNNGTESIQGIYAPGDILPITWIIKKLFNLNIYRGPEIFYYETITDCVLHTITQEKFQELSNTDSELYKTVSYITAKRLETYIHNFENVSLQGADKRLAHQMLYLAKHMGVKTNDGIKIPVPLKQKDFASLIDVTRETVSVNLKILRDKKLIGNSSTIYVKDVEALEEFAYG